MEQRVFGSYEGLGQDLRKKVTPVHLEEKENDKLILLKCSERKSGQRSMYVVRG